MSSPHIVVNVVICIVQGRLYVQNLSDKSPDFLPGLRDGLGMGLRVSLDLQGKTINIPRYDSANQRKANIKGEDFAIYQSPDSRHGW